MPAVDRFVKLQLNPPEPFSTKDTVQFSPSDQHAVFDAFIAEFFAVVAFFFH